MRSARLSATDSGGFDPAGWEWQSTSEWCMQPEVTPWRACLRVIYGCRWDWR